MKDKSEEQALEEQAPEFHLGKVKANPSPVETSIATKMLMAYDKAEEDIRIAVEDNKLHGCDWYVGITGSNSSGYRAAKHFIESITEEEASSGFCRAVMTFGPTLHWNDVAYLCFWVLGLDGPSPWDAWEKRKAWKKRQEQQTNEGNGSGPDRYPRNPV